MDACPTSRPSCAHQPHQPRPDTEPGTSKSVWARSGAQGVMSGWGFDLGALAESASQVGTHAAPHSAPRAPLLGSRGAATAAHAARLTPHGGAAISRCASCLGLPAERQRLHPQPLDDLLHRPCTQGARLGGDATIEESAVHSHLLLAHCGWGARPPRRLGWRSNPCGGILANQLDTGHEASGGVGRGTCSHRP